MWTLGYVAELLSVSLQAKLVWADVQFVGVIALPAFWLLGMRRVVGAPRLSRRVLAALGLSAVALMAVVLLDPAGLFRGQPAITFHGSLPVLDADYGVLYYAAGLPYTFVLVTWTLLVLGRATAHARRAYRRRNVLLMAATLLPVAGGVLYMGGVPPFRDFNPAMAMAFLSALLCAWVVWRYRLFDIAPLARDAVIEHLADGVVVLDGDGRIVDYNRAAARIFPELAAAPWASRLPRCSRAAP